VEVPEGVWEESLEQIESESEGFDPFIGVCMGLSFGAVAWAVVLSVWYALVG
jgi:hypothetical protein